MRDKNLIARVDEFWSRQASLGVGSRVVGFNSTDVGEAGFVTNIKGDAKSGYEYHILNDKGKEYVIAESWVNSLIIPTKNKNLGYAPAAFNRVLKRYCELISTERQ